MRCPKCDFIMEAIKYDGVEIDRCTGCKGIWFDKGEAEIIAEKLLASYIDGGVHSIDSRRDEQDTIPCPRCMKIMDRFFDIDGQQIQYEQCAAHGKFMDAGEFTLWAESRLC